MSKLQSWWRRTGRYVFLSWDVALGVPVGAGVGLAAGHVHKLLANGLTMVIAELAFGAAVLAVVLTALSILVAFMGEEYLTFLEASPLGVRGAIEPFRVMAVVVGCQIFSALSAAFCWPVAPAWGQSIAVGTATGLAVWALVGTVSLVKITAKHGYLRSRLPELRQVARDNRAAALKKPAHIEEGTHSDQ
jgi:hypothetical protein